MSAKIRKCPFCHTTNKRDLNNCKSCNKFIIDINQNKPIEIERLCEKYINEKFTNPSSVSFINRYFEKIGVDPIYYEEYLEIRRKDAAQQNRVMAFGKLFTGIALLVAGIIQCFGTIIWLWSMGMCIVFGIMLITLGSQTLITGNK